MKWEPKKREVEERMGQNDKREEGKQIGGGGSEKR
jgi:hypothetical protein